MKNKFFLILILLASIIALIGLFTSMITNFESGEIMLSLGFSAVNILGTAMLIKNSTLTKTIYFKYISILIGIVFFGVMFKIMHWPDSSIMLAIGLLGIPSVYVFRFIYKQIKTQLDIMKLIWVITAYTIVFGIIMHWLPRYMSYLPNLMLLLIIFKFALICFKDKFLFNS